MDHLKLPSLDAPANSPFADPKFAATPLGAGNLGRYRAADPGMYGARATINNGDGPSTAATVVPSHRPNKGGLNIGFDPHARGNRQIVLDPHIQGDIHVMPIDALSAEDIQRARAVSEQRAQERTMRAQQATGDVSPETIAEIDRSMMLETAIIASALASERGAAPPPAPRAVAVPLVKSAAPPAAPTALRAAAPADGAPGVPGLPNDREAYERFLATSRQARPAAAAPPQAEPTPPSGQHRVFFDTPAGELTATYDRVALAGDNLLILAYDLRRNTPQTTPKQPNTPDATIVAWVEGSPNAYDVIIPNIRFDIDHLRVIVLFIRGTRPLEGAGGHL